MSSATSTRLYRSENIGFKPRDHGRDPKGLRIRPIEQISRRSWEHRPTLGVGLPPQADPTSLLARPTLPQESGGTSVGRRLPDKEKRARDCPGLVGPAEKPEWADFYLESSRRFRMICRQSVGLVSPPIGEPAALDALDGDSGALGVVHAESNAVAVAEIELD
jgi:hypothetical protein